MELLARAALSAQLPEPLRGEVAASAWTRAIMLGRYDIADKLAPEVARDYPVTRKLVEDYLQAGSPKQKRDSGLFLILHFPGLRPYVNAGEARRELLEKIDNFRDNWWCLDSGTSLEQMNFEHQNDRESSRKRKAPPGPAFLSEEDARNAHSQWQQLVKGGTGPDYLARETLKWASEEPSDSRIAEALHLAVRSTRYGCDDRETSKLSHKAFKLLHSRYSASKWAKETPYWFGGTNY